MGSPWTVSSEKEIIILLCIFLHCMFECSVLKHFKITITIHNLAVLERNAPGFSVSY